MNESVRIAAEVAGLVARRTGRARIVVRGSSMEPLLRAGMVIEVEPLTERPRLGDVIVFRAGKGLVAHRLVGGELLSYRGAGRIVADRVAARRGETLLTCGDAHPDRPEVIGPGLVLGRVCAVWSSGSPDAKRIDGPLHTLRGALLARSRRTRALAGKLQTFARVLATHPRRAAPAPAFGVLMDGAALFESGRYARAVALLESVPLPALLAAARRHRTGGLIAGWLDDASRAGAHATPPLRDAFRRLGRINRIQAGRVLACARDVHRQLDRAGIPHVFLKGAARLAAGEHGADLLFSSDVDVLVPAGMPDRAMAALRRAGYRDVATDHGRTDWDHHREPLFSPDVDVPVEVHALLATPRATSRRLDFEALAANARRVTGPAGEVDTLDEVGSALHLAYHARDFSTWRDIVLLSRLFRTFDPQTRSRFDARVDAERRDGVRLGAAVAAADSLAFGVPPRGAAARYVQWARLREDLPVRLRECSDVLELLTGRGPVGKLTLQQARREPAAWVKTWLLGLLAIPAILRAGWWRAASGHESLANVDKRC